jgi:hypothetical protein
VVLGLINCRIGWGGSHKKPEATKHSEWETETWRSVLKRERPTKIEKNEVPCRLICRDEDKSVRVNHSGFRRIKIQNKVRNGRQLL